MTLLFIIFAFVTGFSGGVFFSAWRYRPNPLSDQQVQSLWSATIDQPFEDKVRAVEKAHGIY